MHDRGLVYWAQDQGMLRWHGHTVLQRTLCPAEPPTHASITLLQRQTGHSRWPARTPKKIASTAIMKSVKPPAHVQAWWHARSPGTAIQSQAGRTRRAHAGKTAHSIFLSPSAWATGCSATTSACGTPAGPALPTTSACMPPLLPLYQSPGTDLTPRGSSSARACVTKARLCGSRSLNARTTAGAVRQRPESRSWVVWAPAASRTA